MPDGQPFENRQEVTILKQGDSSMRLSTHQKSLLRWFVEGGKHHRGRWIESIPIGMTRTFNSLRARGVIEERTIDVPPSKWPKERRRILCAYRRIQFRITPASLRQLRKVPELPGTL